MKIEIMASVVLNSAKNIWKNYSAIDYPVERYFVVDNSEQQFPDLTKTLSEIKKNPNKNVEEVFVLHNNINSGFPGAVNQIVKQNIDCNYWFITNDDWHVKPGELKKLATRLEKHFIGLLVESGPLNGYSSFVKSSEMVKKIGLFDENFYPVYCDDNDHRYRLKLAGLQWENFFLKADHKISSTLHSSKKFEEKNQFTFQKNIEYYIKKWGGDRGKEVYKTPFNLPVPIDYWPYDPDRIYEQTWI